MRTLLLMRHAQAVDVMPGHADRDRPLTDRGRAQATAAGDRLRAEGVSVDRVLCSSAVRTRETAEGLGLGCPVDLTDAIYEAGSDTIAELITLVDDDVETLLVVGHSPGVPALAHGLYDPDRSDRGLVDLLDRGFPTATVARYDIAGPWSKLGEAPLRDLWLHR